VRGEMNVSASSPIRASRVACMENVAARGVVGLRSRATGVARLCKLTFADFAPKSFK
jgi:hypothetical protein